MYRPIRIHRYMNTYPPATSTFSFLINYMATFIIIIVFITTLANEDTTPGKYYTFTCQLISPLNLTTISTLDDCTSQSRSTPLLTTTHSHGLPPNTEDPPFIPSQSPADYKISLLRLRRLHKSKSKLTNWVAT